MSLKFLSGELQGETDREDSPILDGHEYDADAKGDACALNGELYGLGSEVCWGHLKLRCGTSGWIKAGECGRE